MEITTTKVLIGLIGDEDGEVTAHRAIPPALKIAGDSSSLQVDYEWIPTSSGTVISAKLKEIYDGLWCVPASLYKDVRGALDLIKTAREQKIPLLGTCGGFQHMALEFAKTRLGLEEADNAEENPDASMPLIAPLVCSLVEVSDNIYLKDNTLLKACYGQQTTHEKYHCRYGLNKDYIHLFEGTELTISAHDKDNDPRALEISDHPFYMGVAYQPERSALENHRHPLISAFINNCSKIS
ncbi:hypothetical protein AB833_10835 [Chromatiales bacterium (ex Bugula neritina AB1)]|nr:hypothetical protein AB833_10835 [Chromatiales bacterium (ex Bugula neritina AB1)]